MKKFLFIPGLPRCATTSLAQVLGQHPSVYLPKIKEPHYFLPNKNKYYMFDREGNKITFQNSGFLSAKSDFNRNYLHFREAKFFIDGSTLYAANHEAIDQIFKEKDIDPYFIILKRDPFKRALSHFLYSVSRGEEFRTFKRALEDEIDQKYPYWLLKGYLAGSDSSHCENKIIHYWGQSKLLTADIDKNEVFTNQFMRRITDFMCIHHFDFDFTEKANALVYSDNKFMTEIRILLKRIRQLNPAILDNKITRSFFEWFMKKMRTSKNIYEENDVFKDYYNELFYKGK
jgi:hypothetical protein